MIHYNILFLVVIVICHHSIIWSTSLVILLLNRSDYVKMMGNRMLAFCLRTLFIVLANSGMSEMETIHGTDGSVATSNSPQVHKPFVHVLKALMRCADIELGDISEQLEAQFKCFSRTWQKCRHMQVNELISQHVEAKSRFPCLFSRFDVFKIKSLQYTIHVQTFFQVCLKILC